MRTLLMVPVLSVCSAGLLKGANVLVLDDVLAEGVAGVYFRRLRMKVALNPEARREYDEKRHEYLRSVLPDVLVDDSDVVIIGTHPSDVDLMEFDKVAAVRMADDGLRKLGRRLYGDVALAGMEYWSVLRVIADAVDIHHSVVDVAEILTLVVRQYPAARMLRRVVSQHRQREVLSAILVAEPEASVWLEPERRIDLNVLKGFLISDYDYLRCVLPEWRDSVLRLLGSAPALSTVFRIPWFAVDIAAVHTLCYRTTARGVPAVSMRGESLVDFVRTRVASEFSAGEAVGTWVSALISDDVTAVDSWRAAGDVALLEVASSTFEHARVEADYRVEVPREYAWAYASVPNVVVVEWDGERRVDGEPVFRESTMYSLRLAQLFGQYAADPVVRTELIALIRQLHVGLMVDELAAVLYTHAVQLLLHGPDVSVFEPCLTAWMPGYTYLSAFPLLTRQHVVSLLGMNPTVSAVVRVAHVISTNSPAVSFESVMADCARVRLLAGVSSVVETSDMLVGGYNLSSPGYCYLLLFRPEVRVVLAFALGAYPLLSYVLDSRLSMFWDHVNLQTVYVTYTGLQGYMPILHFSRTKSGVMLLDLLSFVGGTGAQIMMASCVVGDDGVGQCITTPQFIFLIIGWTIVGMAILIFFGRMWYVSCTKGRNRGGGGGYGAYR